MDPGANAPPGAADGTERDVASITVEVGGVVHLGHYSTRNGDPRHLRLLVKADPIGWHGERPESIGQNNAARTCPRGARPCGGLMPNS